jgi:polyferredoxin
MNGRRSIWPAARSRTVVQIAMLLLFGWLFVQTRLRADTDLNPLLKLFFWIDPLLLLATWLTAHAVPLVMLSSLGLVLATIVLGRVFCGWICPLGTIHAAVGWVVDRLWPNKKRRDHWSPWQRTKYYLLAGFLAMAVLGGHWVCVFDPLVLLYRSMTSTMLPGVQWAVDESSTAIYQADPGVGKARLTTVTEPVREFFHNRVYLSQRNWTFQGSWLILLLFVATLLANVYRRRFWCRYLCPLGALLGVFAWRPLLRRNVQADACNHCDLCAQDCHGAANAAAAAAGDEVAAHWKRAECFVCMNCSTQCHRDGLSFALVKPWSKEPAAEGVDLSKRMLLASAAGGLATLWMMRTTPQAAALQLNNQEDALTFNPLLIRPPGARAERDFLQRCLACGLCMKVCPTGGLQPTLAEAGLEGIWTPRLVPQLGYCSYDCNLCSQVCPTEALQPLTVEEKKKVRIGLAAFDVTRCLPYAYGRDCIVCEEHCPIPNKAIYTLEVEIQDRKGQKRTIKQPHVDPDLCIGCGICEHVCPYKDGPAVRVRSANESRHAERNQPILPGDNSSPY